MQYLRIFVFVLVLVLLACVNKPTFAQLPTFGPSCDETVTPVPSDTQAPVPTSPPNQPTYTPVPTYTPAPTATVVPCTPSISPSPTIYSGQGGNPTTPTKTLTPTKKPSQPVSGTADTTIAFLGFAAVLLISGMTGFISFKPDSK
jgi:hypothetical protein